MHPVTYQTEPSLTSDEFIDLLVRATLAERRPVEDRERIGRMSGTPTSSSPPGSRDASSAWRGRSPISPLAVISPICHETFQRQGIGKELMRRVAVAAGPQTKLILLAAPKAVDYYPRIGMVRHESCWVSA